MIVGFGYFSYDFLVHSGDPAADYIYNVACKVWLWVLAEDYVAIFIVKDKWFDCGFWIWCFSYNCSGDLAADCIYNVASEVWLWVFYDIMVGQLILHLYLKDYIYSAGCEVLLWVLDMMFVWWHSN